MQLPISLLKVAVHAEAIIETFQQIHVNMHVLLKNKSGNFVNLGYICGVIKYGKHILYIIM